MNAEEVVKKIYADANAEADRIRANAKSKAESENALLEAELADFLTETGNLAKKAAEQNISRMLANTRMDIRKEMLTVKQSILGDLSEKAKLQILESGDDAYLSLIESLLIKAVETGSEMVIIGEDEKRINSSFIKQVNRNLGPGYKGNILIGDEKTNIRGGFILRRGNVQTNVSIEVLVDQICEDIGTEIAGDLFD